VRIIKTAMQDIKFAEKRNCLSIRRPISPMISAFIFPSSARLLSRHKSCG